VDISTSEISADGLILNISAQPLSLPSPIPEIGHGKKSLKIKVRYFCIWNLQLLTDPPIFS
jgi:hypothetical protein